MEYKDVIKTIEVAKAEVEWNYPLDYQEAFDVAVECIEKQIPKKPKMPHKYIREWECQRCKSYFAQLNDRPRYCCECGQRIDWGEVE